MRKGRWSPFDLHDDEVRVVIQRKQFVHPTVYAIKGRASIEVLHDNEEALFYENNPTAIITEAKIKLTLEGKFDEGNLARKYSEEKKWKAVARNILQRLEAIDITQDGNGNYMPNKKSKQEVYGFLDELKEMLKKRLR